MSLALLLAVIVLVALTGAIAWLARQVARSSAALENEVEALAQLRTARELLVLDLERTRRRFGSPTDVWPSGRGR